MTDDDVQELVALLEQAQTEWGNGTFNALFDLSQAMIFGPFPASIDPSNCRSFRAHDLSRPASARTPEGTPALA